jgi:hypothetical protein
MSIRGKLQRLTEKTAGLRFSSRKWDEGKDPHDHHPANNFDRFRNGIENMIDMPERTLNKLFGFLRQDQGRLSKRAKESELAGLLWTKFRRLSSCLQTHSAKMEQRD